MWLEFRRVLFRSYYKSVKVDDDGDATPHTTETPYQARQTALDILKKQI